MLRLPAHPFSSDSQIFCHYVSDFFRMTNGDCITYAEIGTAAYYYITYIWPNLDFLIAFAVPSVILVCSTIAIIVKVILSKKKMIGSSQQAPNTNIKGMTAMLVAVCIVVLVTNTPGWIFWNFVFSNWYARATTVEEIATFRLVDTLVLQLWYLQLVTNFFAYIVSARRFRKELMMMLKDTLHRICPNAGEPVSNTGTAMRAVTRPTAHNAI